MPAKTKYLSSPGQRFSKITAGILGGYLLTMAFHMMIGAMLTEKSGLVLTTAYSAFLMWVLLMIVAFISKKAWKVWLGYISGIIICAIMIFIFK